MTTQKISRLAHRIALCAIVIGAMAIAYSCGGDSDEDYINKFFFCPEGGSTAGQATVETTIDFSSITHSTAIAGGNVTNQGSSAVTQRGVCWATTPNPTIANQKMVSGSGFGIYTCNITGITAGNSYYVRAFATNKAGTAYGRQLTFAAIQIGDTYKGGKVAYIFLPGDPTYVEGEMHGLIAAPTDQSAGAPWGCPGTTIATSRDLGTGSANTTAIVTSCSSAGTAARICYDLVLNGFNDWYLPSYEELNKLYVSKDVIGGFNSNIYWSSSEYAADQGLGQVFTTGGRGYASKSNSFAVRAIRSF